MRLYYTLLVSLFIWSRPFSDENSTFFHLSCFSACFLYDLTPLFVYCEVCNRRFSIGHSLDVTLSRSPLTPFFPICPLLFSPFFSYAPPRKNLFLISPTSNRIRRLRSTDKDDGRASECFACCNSLLPYPPFHPTFLPPPSTQYFLLKPLHKLWRGRILVYFFLTSEGRL